jgi:hypothetical protein
MKAIAKLFVTLIKTALILLMLALLTPILFFAWRANQPMDMPEFKGLTYIQYMDWSKMAFEDLAVKYDQIYPDGLPLNSGHKVKHGMCFGVRTGTDVLRATNSALNVLLTHKRPFFSTWWGTFEEWIWSEAEFQAGSANVIFCRLQPNIPTPEQYESMKQERAANNP